MRPLGLQIHHWAGLTLVACLAMLPCLLAPASVAFAQAGDPGAGNAAAGDPGAGTGSDIGMSYLTWAFDACGIFYSVIFLALSFAFVALLVMNLLTVRRDTICPLRLIEGFETQINEKRYQDAYELAKADESFLGHVLAAGLAKLSTGYAEAVESMQEIGEDENMKLEHRLSYLALIGTVAPMVGLFGTVDGMIRSFRVIAAQNTTPKASDLAAGISTALFTTLIGLAIAIPAIGAYNLIKNRIARLVLEVGIISGSLIGKLKETAKP